MRFFSPCFVHCFWLTIEQICWLERLANFTTEPKVANAKKPGALVIEDLFLKGGVFCPDTIRSFDDFCHESHASESAEKLSAQTFRKGLYSLVSSIFALAGKNLTNLDASSRERASHALAVLNDLSRNWSSDCITDLNQSESRQLQHVANSAPAKEIMTGLYALYLASASGL